MRFDRIKIKVRRQPLLFRLPILQQAQKWSPKTGDAYHALHRWRILARQCLQDSETAERMPDEYRVAPAYGCPYLADP